MDPTALSPQHAQVAVHIYNHPESRIAFLETALSGQQWRATLYASALEPGQNLATIKEKLTRHGYHVEEGRDKHGTAVLNILHLPSEAGLMESIHALGLTSGVQHTLSNTSASSLFGTVKHGAQYIINDKAHILSAFYLLGDGLLMFAGADNKAAGEQARKSFVEKLGALRKPENALQSLAGVGSAMNSLIMMVYAQEGNSKDYKHMKEQFYSAMIHGKDPTEVTAWQPEQKPQGVLGKANQWLEAHPIAGSTTAQITSQILLMASGGMSWNKAASSLPMAQDSLKKELKENIRGSQLNIARGIVSSLGWLGMLYPAHKVEKKDPWYSPVRAVQEFQEHPERFASVLTGGASVVGVMASRDNRNASQFIGEASLILGDVTIFFTDMGKYGNSKSSAETIAETAAKFIHEAPALMDETQQTAFVQRLSYYLAGKRAAAHPEINPAQEASVIAERITMALSSQPSRLNEVVDCLTQMIVSLPTLQRDPAMNALTRALTEMPGVYVSAERLQQEITRRMDVLSPQPGSSQTIQQLAPHMATLITHLPTLALPQNAMRLYDVLSQFAASSPRDKIYLSHAMKERIAQHTGIAPQMLNQWERQAQSSAPQLH